jgi:hypothetical protein
MVDVSFEKIMSSSVIYQELIDYNLWAERVFGAPFPRPNYALGSSFDFGTKYGSQLERSTYPTILQFSLDLFDMLVDSDIEGSIIEFGVFNGYWLDKLLSHMAQRSSFRPVLGFDSFQGLPKPSVSHDFSGWQEGMYRASFDTVVESLKVDERPHLTLVPGWFSDTLHRQPASTIKNIAYARVDCDLYEPTVEVLQYLTDRLVDGAILFFDDWTYFLDKGETKAFAEWSQEQSRYRFEILGFVNVRIAMRVWHAHAHL